MIPYFIFFGRSCSAWWQIFICRNSHRWFFWEKQGWSSYFVVCSFILYKTSCADKCPGTEWSIWWVKARPSGSRSGHGAAYLYAHTLRLLCVTVGIYIIYCHHPFNPIWNYIHSNTCSHLDTFDKNMFPCHYVAWASWPFLRKNTKCFEFLC